jgi:hypothetical protein
MKHIQNLILFLVHNYRRIGQVCRFRLYNKRETEINYSPSQIANVRVIIFLNQRDSLLVLVWWQNQSKAS